MQKASKSHLQKGQISPKRSIILSIFVLLSCCPILLHIKNTRVFSKISKFFSNKTKKIYKKYTEYFFENVITWDMWCYVH
jgi:hypothetical protein